MLRRPLSHCLGLLVLLLSVTARAEVEYWISVGSYQNLINAEIAQREASARLPESFSITQAETDSGFFYRVLAGPYLTREIADHMLGESRRQGFESAWILAAETGLSTLGSSPVDPLSTDYEYDLPTYERQDPEDLPPIELEERPDRSTDHQMIDEAPEGYNLHRLNRDQTAIDWSSPFLLATNSAAVIESAALALNAASPIRRESVVAIDLNDQEPLVLQQWEHDQADIKIDGNLDEAAWQNAMAISELRVTEPDTLLRPRYATEVRIFYTDRGVYVSFDMEQPQDTLIRRLSSRDNRDVKRDYVSFTLDTSGSARYAYWMTLALGDTQMDGTALPERQFSSNWDGAWWGASVETERGWAAEFFVPWSQMTMPQQEADGSRRIGFYSARLVAHLNERWAWPALPQSYPKFMSAFQALQVQDVNPRQQWSLFPYASSTADMVVDQIDWKAGIDVFWRPATNTQLTATVNPDFGTVEADEVIVNLTAFETFFPEKRLFFLEGREIFESNARSRGFDPIILLNTRRIGGSPRILAEDADADVSRIEAGQPTELYGAGKVTGQVGGFRYGVLTAFEQDTDLAAEDFEEITAPGRNFAVGRFLYENNSGGVYRAAGAMTTLTTHPDEDATTAGVDLHLLSRGGIWKLDGQLLYSNLDLSGAGGGGFFDAEYTPRQGMKYKLEGTYLDRALDLNDAGFMRRNDKVGGRIGTEWIKSGFTSFRDFKIETFLRYEENLDGYAIRSGIGGEGEFTLNNLHGVEIGLKWFPARYDDRNSFGNGTYKIEDRPSFEVGYKTDRSRQLSAFLFSQWEGDGVDGQKLEGKLGLNWRPVDRLNFEVSTSYEVRDGWLLHQEGVNMTAFDAEEWQPELKMDFFLTARQELRMKLQWVGIKAFEDRFYQVPETPGDLIEVEKPNEESDDFTVSAMNFQVRYRWQIAPLSDLFLVYTRNGFDDTVPASFSELFENAWNDPLGEQLVLKVRYRLGS
jgi:hypothetical protein